MVTLRTIGYEAVSPAAFLAELRKAGISCVLDIRALPISRKRGFSKNTLREFLHSEGVGYVHLPALGNPKPGREAAKAGRTSDFRKNYSNHLKTHDAQAALSKVAEYASVFSVCLLCFEREARACHRSMVAAELALSYSFGVEHLIAARSERQVGFGP